MTNGNDIDLKFTSLSQAHDAILKRVTIGILPVE